MARASTAAANRAVDRAVTDHVVWHDSSRAHVLRRGRTRLHELPCRPAPDEVRAVVVDAFEPVAFDFGGVIVAEGDEADAFYVIVSGSARVVSRADASEEVSLHVLRQGDYFGEIGLLADSTRIATVRAREPVEAFRLERGVFRALVNRIRPYATPLRGSGDTHGHQLPASPLRLRVTTA